LLKPDNQLTHRYRQLPRDRIVREWRT